MRVVRCAVIMICAIPPSPQPTPDLSTSPKPTHQTTHNAQKKQKKKRQRAGHASRAFLIRKSDAQSGVDGRGMTSMEVQLYDVDDAIADETERLTLAYLPVIRELQEELNQVKEQLAEERRNNGKARR
eukprot:183044-Rhodomonas_salina.2